MKVFVAGGTGFVGEHLVKQLLSDGHTVKLLVHKSAASAGAVERVAGDISKVESFERSVAGCDAIINLIGIIREFPFKGITFERLHVRATENLLKVAEKTGVRRYLHMSALGSRAGAVSGYHKSKWRAEELVRASVLDWTIFQPSLIFGPNDAFINMLADQLRLSPFLPVIGSGSYRLQPIHADDVARCFSHALEMPETIGQSYELCGNDRLSYEDLLDAIATASGRSLPLKPHIPLSLMKMVIPVMQNIPQFPITMDQLQMLLEDNIGSSDWQKVFGFEPRALREGISEYLGKF